MTSLESTYEELTLHQQIAPEIDAVQGWPLHFPDGTPPQSVESTAVRSLDWYGFRDPNESIYVSWVASAHEVESTLVHRLGQFEQYLESGDVEQGWLRKDVAGVAAVLPYVDRAYFRVLSRAHRLALSDTVTLALVFGAADALRHVEHAAARRAAIEIAVSAELFGDIERLWAQSAGWQPLRSAVETLLATEDWVEAVVAINLVLEPLVGRFLREQYLSPAAAAHGDVYTPAIVQSWRRDSARAGRWTAALVDHLLTDPTHGPANRTVITGWAHRWERHASAAALAPLLDDSRTGANHFGHAWRTVVEQYHDAVAGRWTSQLLVEEGER